MEINLGKYIKDNTAVLVGRDNGKLLKKMVEEDFGTFERLEEKNQKLIVIIPTNIDFVNKSFFLGLFETQIQRLGLQDFNKKYKFQANEIILSKIPEYTKSALLFTGRSFNHASLQL